MAITPKQMIQEHTCTLEDVENDKVARVSKTGSATLILEGLELGFESIAWTIFLIGLRIVISMIIWTGAGTMFAFYGVALAGPVC
jgi:Na+/H+-translocating membrane pyrophosphatase